MCATLAWAQAHGYLEHNVAGDSISGALPGMPAVKEHYRALPYGDVPIAIATLEASGASLPAELCLCFLMLTAARSGETRGATWDEIDLDVRESRIPATRMRAKVE